jgi:hypothetical protein
MYILKHDPELFYSKNIENLFIFNDQFFSIHFELINLKF